MSEEVNHNCGLCVTHTLHDAHSFIRSLQHRGREAVGIAAIAENKIDVIKWKGTVDNFDLTDLHKIFPRSEYRTYMAHIRYATKGKKNRILEDAHPIVVGGEIQNKGSHTIILNCDIAAVHNGQVNDECFENIDKNLLKTGCDTEALLHLFRREGEYGILRKISGAYTMAIADKRKKDVVVLRDRTGIKPGVLGWKDGEYVAASEDIAFRKNGAILKANLHPGYAYYFALDGTYDKKKIIEPQIRHCFFEWNYLADVDSILNNVSVLSIRRNLGEILAEEFCPKDADLVTFLPRCPEAAAESYSGRTGIPFESVFYKKNAERAFQGSIATDRKNSINENLHLLPHIKNDLKEKTIILMDDSIVRGNNAEKARKLLYEEAEVKKVYFVSYTPPLCDVGNDGIPRGCMYGIDMPPELPPGEREYVARGRSVEEISNEIGMPMYYISLEGMLKAYENLGISEENLCTFCIGGEKPF